MHVLVIDFESYYSVDYTLSKLSTEAYIRDPRWQTIGVGIRNADNTARVWLEHDQFAAWAAQQDWSQIGVISHHGQFEGLILQHHYNVRPGMLFDTLSMANACRPHQRKSLANLAKNEGLGEKGNEVVQAKGKRREDFTPEEWAQYGVYCLNDCDLEYGLFVTYLPYFSADELRIIDITLRMFSEPVLHMDVQVLTQHHQSEIERKAALIARCAADKELLMSNDKFAQLLMDYGVDPPRKWSEAKTKSARLKDPDAPNVYSWAFAKTDVGMRELLEHPDPEVAALAEARVGVKSTIEETRAKRYLAIISRGPAPVYLNYHRAHTGRWTGGDKANFQNLKRGGVLRDAILAPPGHKIVVADSAQIEARVLAWTACETWLVEAFASGRDIYSEYASELYNRPVDRKRKEIVDGKEVFPDFIPGFVSKTCTLGLGFQMWWPKLAGTMLQGAMGGPPVQFTRDLLEQMQIDYSKFINNPKKIHDATNIPSRLSQAEMVIHCIVSEALVLRYRDKNKAIVYFWEVCQKAIEDMARGAETAFGRNGIFKTSHGCITLPSGRRLLYPDLSYDIRNAGKKNQRLDWSYWNGMERTKIYGGLLCENLIQAAARDIVAGQMVRYADTGRKVATMTHDEIVGVTADADAHAAQGTLLELMKQPPVWAPGLPLFAEGGIGQRYGDAK